MQPRQKQQVGTGGGQRLASLATTLFALILLAAIASQLPQAHCGTLLNSATTTTSTSQPPYANVADRQALLLQQVQPQVLANGNKQQISQQQQQQQPINSNPYTAATYSLLLDLRQQMINKALKFDDHFRNLLSSSKISLHNMFVDTYGMMYQHNTEIFTSMFESLEQYYATGQIKLTKMMETFFERLYQKIFQVVNTNRAFSPSYLECATEQLAHLKPFRDTPEKLIAEIKHTFVAARTFNVALNNGIDVIKGIISVSCSSNE